MVTDLLVISLNVATVRFEYVVWQIADQKLNWFSLQSGEYVPLTPDDSGVIKSHIFPGLNLPVAVLLQLET